MEDTADYRYVTDFELNPQTRNKIKLTRTSVSAKHPIMWRMNPTLANQVLPSEISTQEEGDTIHLSVKWVNNNLKWKFLVASIEILTKFRQEQQDADAMESVQVRDTT